MTSGPRATMDRAIVEFERARADSDEMGRREAAEKAWLAVIEAADSILAANGTPVAPGKGAHSERRRKLEGIGRSDLSDDYAIFSEQLHGDCFYEGNCPTDSEMLRKLKHASQFVDEARDAN